MTLQLLISAVFIILGSLRRVEAHTAIAVLGAISTVTGDDLALMNGHGLPNGLREARDQMQYVVFEAEELFWDFRAGKHILYEDIKKLREDYLRVMEQLRMNHPDSYSKAASNIISGSSVTKTKVWRK